MSEKIGAQAALTVAIIPTSSDSIAVANGIVTINNKIGPQATPLEKHSSMEHISLPSSSFQIENTTT